MRFQIHTHGLLTDDMAVYTEDNKGNLQYNYMYVDALFDFLHSIGMKPFVELGFMPGRLASGPQTIFWWRGNVTPPKDYEKWAGLIKDLTEHLTERYGAEEVKSWYFEVWNEPNLSPGFWTGTQEDYFKLYKYSAQSIKSVNKEYRVGGKGKVLNATVLGTPEGNVFLNSLVKAKDNGVVKRIEILGSKEKISWKQNTGSVSIQKPKLVVQ